MSDLTERVARALFVEEQCDRRQAQDVEANWAGRLNEQDQDEYRALADTALAAVAEAPGLEEALAKVLREHQPTTGMSVASGVTCRCGYWNGNEVSGKTRPVGYQGLQWHQAQEQSDAIRAWLRGETT